MKKIFLFIASLLFGLMFINAGLNKFFNYMPVPEDLPEATMKDFQAMMEIVWLMPLIGFAEVVGGLLVIFRKTRAIGILILMPVITGILLTHIIVDRSGLVVILILLAILAWMIFEERRRFFPLLKAGH